MEQVAGRHGRNGVIADSESARLKILSRRNLILGASCISGAALAGCGVPGANTARVRFKVVARARLGGEDYEGFAVNELIARYTPNALSGFKMSRTLKMEATVVDFGGKADALFVLLTDYLPAILTIWGIPGPGNADETTIPLLKQADGVREVPRRVQDRPDLAYPFYPHIAAFRNEADPSSVYEVDPDNLAKAHGLGARFLGLAIEIVDQKMPLTNSVARRLEWLDTISERSLLQPRAYLSDKTAELGRRITAAAFKSEE